MKKVRFLILTDHSEHSDQNSVYALTRTLAADPRTAFVFVASRGDARNDAFFSGELDFPVYGLTAGEDFTFDPQGRQFTGSEASVRYPDLDVVWLRLPPPADRTFFAAMTDYGYDGPLVINDPAGILETGDKTFLSHFSAFTAPTRQVRSVEDVRIFAGLHPIVLKPTRAYGGKGLVRIADGQVEAEGRQYTLEEWLPSAAEDLRAGNYLAMKYLKNVTEGDKRILVVNGKILGASLRIPAPGQWLCNVSRGGKSVIADVTPEEQAMVAAVAPVLLRKGVVIFGADTLVDDDGRRVLSEINTNSIGGFPQAEAQTGRPVVQQTIDEIYDYLAPRI